MLKRLLEEDRAKLLGSIGLNSLGDLYSVFPPKAREFSEGVFTRLKDLLQKSPHAAVLRDLLLEDEVPFSGPLLWNQPYGRYLAKELDRLHYEFPDELLHSPALLDLAMEYQSFLCNLLRTEVASFSFSSGFSALLEGLRVCLIGQPAPQVRVAASLPKTWQRALEQNFPGVRFTFGELAALTDDELRAVTVFLSTSEVAPVELTALRPKAPQARFIDVLFDPLSLYPHDDVNPFDFTVLEMQDILSAHRQITGLSAGVLAGQRSHFTKAQTWLVGKSRVTKTKTWFQPSSGSHLPLPRFLPLEGLKVYLAWEAHDTESLIALAENARRQFASLKGELERMGVPCLASFNEGRQGIFRVPRCESRLAKARAGGWETILPAPSIWGGYFPLDLSSAVWIRVGVVGDSEIARLVEALTHD